MVRGLVRPVCEGLLGAAAAAGHPRVQGYPALLIPMSRVRQLTVEEDKNTTRKITTETMILNHLWSRDLKKQYPKHVTELLRTNPNTILEVSSLSQRYTYASETAMAPSEVYSEVPPSLAQ